ncbi:hypothetical protein D9619_004044 [Psilocybe cf. subviscida]|uniref:Carbonic anhydrase n=1 Tax=Psilocybe cf. subviscida TaxID=2480587 RepID=A0A8H5BPG7_9AGAR|nr:hypothetical protein D9619_004044 [Psilocybe cf. subviscida]
MHGRVVTLARTRRAQTALQISSSSFHHGRLSLSSTISQRFNHSPMRTFGSSSPTAHPCRHRFADIEELHEGNQSYMLDMHSANPGLLSALARRGQQPPFLLFDCSDSRVGESAIFHAAPGRLFTSGNIANRFDETETGSQAVLSYAVQTLRVKHVVVMGHYGCGGVAASMLPLPERARAGNVVKKPGDLTRPADVAVQGWIQPIREIYETSERDRSSSRAV